MILLMKVRSKTPVQTSATGLPLPYGPSLLENAPQSPLTTPEDAADPTVVELSERMAAIRRRVTNTGPDAATTIRRYRAATSVV